VIAAEEVGTGFRGLVDYIVFEKKDRTDAANESAYEFETPIERHPHGRRIELPELFDNEPSFAGTARRDAPQSLAGLRKLSGGGLVRLGSGPRLLLPSNASANLGFPGAPALAGMRRPGDRGRAGAKKGGHRSGGLKPPQKKRVKRATRGEFVAGTLQGTPREMSRQAAPFRAARPDIAAPVIHYSLSLQAGDGRKTLEEWKPIVEAFLKKMDFPLDAAWTAWLHNDTTHQHCHIGLVRSLGDGSLWNREFSSKRAIQATAEIEREFGLLSHDRTPKRERKSLTRKEQALEQQLKKEGKIMSKLLIKRAVDDFISSRAGKEFTVEELRAALAQQGVELETVERDGGLAGIKFQAEGVWIAGSSLGDGYKAQGLLKRGMQQTLQAQSDPGSAAARAAVEGGDFQAPLPQSQSIQVQPQPVRSAPTGGAPAAPNKRARQRTRSDAEVRSRHMNILVALAITTAGLAAAGWNTLAKLVIALVNSILKAIETVFRLREGALGRLDKDSGQVIPPKVKAGDEDYDQVLDAMDTSAPALESVAKKVKERQFSQLLEHGEAPYQFKPDASDSYFARLRLEDGTETVLWGKDIKRALDEAQAAEGDFIRLQRAGSQAVTVTEKKADGSVEEINTHRNAWRAEVQQDQHDQEAERERERPRG
jgi:hypothetical protein